MQKNRLKRIASYLFFSAGALLLFWGARDFWESQWGQTTAAREFEQVSEPAGEAPIPTHALARHAPAEVSTKAGDTLAKLIIPRLDAELYVIEGDGPKELRRGPGHLMGTAMPGGKGNCVIAGHRDTHFRVLKDIKKGDDIVLQTKEGKFLYQVREMKIVSPENTSALQPTRDGELNLITCYPFYYVGSAPKRFIVQARLAGIVSRAS
jgi:sortase A